MERQRQAVIYARVSSREQEQEGYSIPAQLELLRSYAQRQGFKVIQEFLEAETAKSAGREQFGLMLETIRRQKQPPVILVEKTDRLYRNFKDYVAVEDLMRDCGLEIHLVKEGEILSQSAQSHVKLVHGIKALMAKNYIDNLSEETKKGMLQKVKQGGWPSAPPYGYQMQKGLLVPDPEESRFVQMAFKKYATGNYSLKALAKAMRQEGHRFLPSLPTIPKSNLERLLKRRVYIGEIEFKGEIYPGSHTPLISMDLWAMVQKALKRENKPMKNTKHHFRYQGVFTCGKCGSLLSGDAKKGGRYIYYRCNKAIRKEGCLQPYVNESKIDTAIQGLLSSFILPEDFQQEIGHVATELDGVKKSEEQDESKQIKRKIDRIHQRLRNAYEDRLSGLITAEMYAQVSEDYKNEMAELQVQLEQSKNATVGYYDLAMMLFELPELLAGKWIALPDEKKAGLLRLLSSNSTITDGNVSLELHPVFDYLVNLPKMKTGAAIRAEFENLVALHSVTIEAFYHSLAA